MKSAVEDGKWEGNNSTPLDTADGALGCPQVPLPHCPDPSNPAGVSGWCWAGASATPGGLQGPDSLCKKKSHTPMVLNLDLISKRCLSLNYSSAPLVSIFHPTPCCFCDRLDGFCTPKPVWDCQ